MERVRAGLIGLGFGSEFIPIYQAHPNAEVAAICQRSKSKLDEIGDRFGIATRYTDFRDVLADPNGLAAGLRCPGTRSIQLPTPSGEPLELRIIQVRFLT
jgi:predicted dehydrogenase